MEPIGELTLKGFRRPIPAFNVIAVREPSANVSTLQGSWRARLGRDGWSSRMGRRARTLHVVSRRRSLATEGRENWSAEPKGSRPGPRFLAGSRTA